VAGEIVVALIEIFGELLVRGAVAGGEVVVDEVKEAARRKKEREKEQAFATADILVLAALHDHVITEAERGELARRLPEVLKKGGIETGVEEVIDHFSEARSALRSDRALRRRITQRAAVLTDRQRERLFEAIVQLVKAETALAAGGGVFRTAGKLSPSGTIELFGDALGRERAVIAAAVKG
jgi:hypothetical protein